MKNLVFWAVMGIALVFCGAHTYPKNSHANNNFDELLRIPVKNLRLKAKNIGLILSQFSDQYRVPIGFEVATDDDLSITKSITIDIKEGTVEEVLNSIVSQNPIYTWEIKDDVVNVFPRERNRDVLLKEMLETRLERISIGKQTTRFTLRQMLCENGAVMKILTLHNVTPANDSFGSRDFGNVGRNFSLVASDVSVSTVLNRVIRNSQTKYWIIARYGDKKQYLMLNL